MTQATRANGLWALVAAGVVVTAAGGCGSSAPKRLVPPALDPQAVTAAVMTAADADGNGTLDRQELARMPGLASGLGLLDADSSGSLSAAEITAWLDAIKASRVAITSLALQVTQKGKPLADVTVKLVPEACMGKETKAAEGRTDASGSAMVSIPGSPYPGVNCGIYRAEITGTGSDGKPLPARYNADTILGVAVGGLLPENGTVVFDLD
jgi:hypothetical protein